VRSDRHERRTVELVALTDEKLGMFPADAVGEQIAEPTMRPPVDEELRDEMR
jgi:hypothetical protein